MLEQAAARGKYARLYRRLKSLDADRWEISFQDLETLLGFGLPSSARVHRPWWANQGERGGHSHALAWEMAGWNTAEVRMADERLVFVRQGSNAAARARPAPEIEFEAPHSHSDEVRAYCVRRYVEPARRSGEREIAIRAGDVHEALAFKNRLPLVCSALGAMVFCETNGLRRTAIEGPANGANTVFRFALD